MNRNISLRIYYILVVIIHTPYNGSISYSFVHSEQVRRRILRIFKNGRKASCFTAVYDIHNISKVGNWIRKYFEMSIWVWNHKTKRNANITIHLNEGIWRREVICKWKPEEQSKVKKSFQLSIKLYKNISLNLNWMNTYLCKNVDTFNNFIAIGT